MPGQDAEDRDESLAGVEALVAQGLEREGAERASWLATLAQEAHTSAQQVRERLELLGDLGLGLTPIPVQPRQIGGFVLEELVGLGGMGEVWRARDKEGGRVALKLVRPEFLWFEEARQPFDREAQAVSALDHPRLVRMLAFGKDQRLPWLALEWVEGVSLDRIRFDQWHHDELTDLLERLDDFETRVAAVRTLRERELAARVPDPRRAWQAAAAAIAASPRYERLQLEPVLQLEPLGEDLESGPCSSSACASGDRPAAHTCRFGSPPDAVRVPGIPLGSLF
jgi:hypothetical protein